MQNVDIEELYNEYFKMIYKYLLCLTHNHEIAEDLTQETFCKAIAKIDTFKEDCKVSTWLCAIAKNLWLNELRKDKRSKMVTMNNLPNVQEDIEAKFLQEQNKEELYKKIHELDSLIREIFYLRLLGNLSFKEIGDIMNKSEVWARVNFYRAKQKMKESDKNEKGM